MATVSTLVNRVKVYSASVGSGPFTIGAAVSGFRGSEALVDGRIYSYAVEQDGDYEAGRVQYVASSQSLVRAPIISSRGGAPVPFGANAQVSFTALAEDFAVSGGGGGGGSTTWGSITGTLSAQSDLALALAAKLSAGTVTTSGLTQNTARLLGRWTAGVGAIQEVTLGAGIALSGAGVLTATGSTWGGITGTLSAQTDLAAALAAKQATLASGTNIKTVGGTSLLGAGNVGTTIGGNMLALPNPSAITFPRFNADNSISPLDATAFRAAIGVTTGGTTANFNVKDYGALGNDSANDYAAIAAATTAAAAVGGNVYFPNGKYKFGTTWVSENVGIIGESQAGVQLKPTHSGVGMQVGRPVGTSAIDTLYRRFENFTVIGNANTTDAFIWMRVQFSLFSRLTVISQLANNAAFRGYRMSGACYFNYHENCFFDSADGATAVTNGRGWHIGNGENEANQAFAACNSHIFDNCRTIRVPVGMDLDNVQGCLITGGGVEICATAGMKLRGSGNKIDGTWFEAAGLIVDSFTPANGAGGFGSATNPTRNRVMTSGPLESITVNASVGLEVMGQVQNLTLGAGCYNFNMPVGRVNGAFSDSSSDSNITAIIGGVWKRLVKNGTSYILQEEFNGSEFIARYPNNKRLRVHAADSVQITTMTYGLELLGNGSNEGGYLDIPKMTDPGAPAASKLRFFCKDNGSGKMQACVRFPTGAILVLGTEP